MKNAESHHTLMTVGTPSKFASPAKVKRHKETNKIFHDVDVELGTPTPNED